MMASSIMVLFLLEVNPIGGISPSHMHNPAGIREVRTMKILETHSTGTSGGKQKGAQAGSKILAEVIRRVKTERAVTTNWGQNWNAHGNHSNNKARPGRV